jgi:hypothetical protein
MRKLVFALATLGAIGAACSLASAGSATLPTPRHNYSPIEKVACGGPSPRCHGDGPGSAAPGAAGALLTAVVIGTGPGATRPRFGRSRLAFGQRGCAQTASASAGADWLPGKLR